MSVDISEENMRIIVKKAFVILVQGYTATQWHSAVGLILKYCFFEIH